MIINFTFQQRSPSYPFGGTYKIYLANTVYNLQNSVSKPWKTVNISDDGTNIFASTQKDVFYSTDSGSTWNTQELSVVQNTNMSTCSSNNKYIYFGTYTSNDYGTTWANITYTGAISCITCSANGKNVLIGNGRSTSNNLVISTDYGTTWSDFNLPNNYISNSGNSFLHSIRSISASDDLSLIALNCTITSTANQYGPLISTDNGTTWTDYSLNFGSIKYWNDISMNGNGQILYTAKFNGVYNSSNNGSAWAYNLKGADSNFVYTSNNGTYVIKGPYLYKSTDGASTFTKITSLTSSTKFGFINDDGTKLLAANNSGLYYSANGGNAFSLQTGTSGHYIYDIKSERALSNICYVAYKGTPPYDWTPKLYVSSNGGSTVTVRTPPPLGGSVYEYRFTLASDSSTGTKIFLTSGYNGSNVYITTDSGVNWSTVTLTNPPDCASPDQYWFISMCCDSIANNVYSAIHYAKNDGSLPSKSYNIIHSNDGGNTWTYKATPNPNIAIDNIKCSDDGSKIFAIANGSAAYYSSDYGVSWTNISTGYKPNGRAIVSKDGTFIGINDRSTNTFYTSTDNGTTWSATSNNFQANLFCSMARSSNGKNIAYSYYSDQNYHSNTGLVYLSTDYGATWNPISNTQNWFGVDMSSDGNNIVYASFSNGHIFKYNVSSNTTSDITYPLTGWNNISTNLDGSDILISPSGTNHPMFVRKDYISSNSVGDITQQLWFNELNELYPYGQSCVTKLQNPQVQASYSGECGGFAIGQSSNVFLIYSASGSGGEGGITGKSISNTTTTNKYWTSISVSQSITIANGSAYLGSNTATYIYVSEDGNGSGGYIYKGVTDNLYSGGGGPTTWTQLTSAGSRNWKSVTCTFNGTYVAAITNTDIYTSSDGGANWTQRISASANGWKKIKYSNYGQVLAALDEGGYYWKSTDYGANWSQVTSAGIGGYKDIFISGNTSVQILADSGSSNTGGYIKISQDGGSTWSQVSNAGINYWCSVSASQDGSSYTAVSSNGGIWSGILNIKIEARDVYYYDYGKYKIKGSDGGNESPYVICSSDDGSVVYKCTSDYYGLAISKDSANSWNLITSTQDLYYFDQVACSGNGRKVIALESYSTAYISNNYGSTWTTAFPSVYSPINPSMSTNGQVIIVLDGDYGNVWKTTDGGSTFTELTASNPSGYKVTSWLKMSDDGQKMAFTTKQGTYNNYTTVLQFTSDGGSTWNVVTPPAFSYTTTDGYTTIYCTISGDGSKIYAMSSVTRELYVSTDNCANWTFVNRTPIGPWDITGDITVSYDGTVLFVYDNSGWEGLGVSRDSGQTWEVQAVMQYGYVNYGCVCPSSTGDKAVMYPTDWKDEHFVYLYSN